MLEELKRDLDYHLILKKLNKCIFLLRLVPDNSPQNAHFEIIGGNSACAKVTGVEEKGIISHKFSLSEHMDEVAEHLLQVAKTGLASKFDFFSMTQERWYSISAFCVQESLLSVIVEDITKHKITEQELEDSEEVLSLTLEIAGEGLWQWHYDEDLVYHNKQWATILGLPAVAGFHKVDDFIKHVHPDDKERVITLAAKVSQSAQPYFSEHRMILEDGRVIWIVDRGIPVKDKNGKYNRMIGSLTDTTKYRQTQQELHMEKEIIRSTLLSVGDGIISIDKEGDILLFNPAAEALTGWRCDEVIGKNVDNFFQLIDPISGELEYPSRKFELLAKKKTPKTEEDKIASLRTRDGRVMEVYHDVSPIRLPDKETVGYIVVFTDVSEMVEKQREIQYYSMHDELTGLYNRHYIRDALSQLDVERNLPITVIVADINNLKATNDTYGHAAGDKLIKDTADFLISAFRKEDVVARVGGDEFCILLPKTCASTAELVKQRLTMNTDLCDVGKNQITLAIGYAVKIDEGESMTDIFAKADRNMYKHKEAQRS